MDPSCIHLAFSHLVHGGGGGRDGGGGGAGGQVTLMKKKAASLPLPLQDFFRTGLGKKNLEWQKKMLFFVKFLAKFSSENQERLKKKSCIFK